jgi:hypothetical protein
MNSDSYEVSRLQSFKVATPIPEIRVNFETSETLKPSLASNKARPAPDDPRGSDVKRPVFGLSLTTND